MIAPGDFSLPKQGFVFWPVGTGDSTTIAIDTNCVIQVDLRQMDIAENEDDPHAAIIEHLIAILPKRNGRPYLAAFVLTHPDMDHCQGFARLLESVHIGELWFSPRILSDFTEDLCDDAAAFKDEARRRLKQMLNGVDESGERLRLIGYSDILEDDEYKELSDEVLAVPGTSVTSIDGEDMSAAVTIFIHAPFKDDAEAERNDTSVGMQVTLNQGRNSCRALLLGDLGNPTLNRIFSVSDDEDLTWNILLAPHHCSKSVMYVRNDDGEDELDSELMEKIEERAEPCRYVVASSEQIPARNDPGDNPPHAKAKNRYEELVESGNFLCTQEHPNSEAPEPISFSVGEDGCLLDDAGDRQEGSGVRAAIVQARGADKPPEQDVRFGRER